MLSYGHDMAIALMYSGQLWFTRPAQDQDSKISQKQQAALIGLSGLQKRKENVEDTKVGGECLEEWLSMGSGRGNWGWIGSRYCIHI